MIVYSVTISLMIVINVYISY